MIAPSTMPESDVDILPDNATDVVTVVVVMVAVGVVVIIVVSINFVVVVVIVAVVVDDNTVVGVEFSVVDNVDDVDGTDTVDIIVVFVVDDVGVRVVNKTGVIKEPMSALYIRCMFVLFSNNKK